VDPVVGGLPEGGVVVGVDVGSIVVGVPTGPPGIVVVGVEFLFAKMM
jgi:hypothetical protein